MKILILTTRIIFGLIFFTFGLNGFFNFIPVPPLSDAANNFLSALLATGYMLPLWKSVEVVVGLMLIFNIYVPLGLVILAPVTANIFLYHLFLDQENVAFGGLLLSIHVLFLFLHRRSYYPLLKVKGEL